LADGYGVRPALFRKLCSAVYKVKFVQILTGIELLCEAIVGRFFVMDRSGGIIISVYARIGDNCRTRNRVVVGLRRIEERFAPVIGKSVGIPAGAKMRGRVKIGDNSIIRANAAVLDDVPGESIVIGVPAIIKPRRSRCATPTVT